MFKSFCAADSTNPSLSLILLQMSPHMDMQTYKPVITASRDVLLLKKQHRDRQRTMSKLTGEKKNNRPLISVKQNVVSYSPHQLSTLKAFSHPLISEDTHSR